MRVGDVCVGRRPAARVLAAGLPRRAAGLPRRAAGLARRAAGRPAGLLPGLLAATLLIAAPGGTLAQAFDLQGHRGARGLAPENTLAAFRKALEIGVTTLETDVAFTRDEQAVLSHDPWLNPELTRGPDGGWLRGPGPAIRSLSLDELRGYDIGRPNPDGRTAKDFPEQQPADGERIPTLSEVFAAAAASGKPVRFNLETKLTPTGGEEALDAARYARLLVDAVQRAGLADRVTIQSFDWRTLVESRRIAPAIATSCLTIESPSMDTVRAGPDGASPWHAGLRRAEHGDSLPRLVKAAGCGTWSMFWRNLTPEHLAEARALGLKVIPWTVNDPAAIARLIDLGVDGIITDYPDRARRVMAQRRMPLP